MNTTNTLDTARLNLLLNELRCPPSRCCGHSSPNSPTRKVGRRPASSPSSPSTRSPNTAAVASSAISSRRGCPPENIRQLRLQGCADDLQGASHRARRWRRLVGQGRQSTLFGPPGGGKSHLPAALGLALIENGWRVLFTSTTDLVQKLQVARRELNLEAAINRLDRFDLLILDDLAYFTRDQAETSVLFELISARYERRSMLITANQPFGEWNRVFPDPAMTLAAIDRLVHHATIVEMNVESYRRRTALERKRGPGRPPSHATPKTAAD